MKSSGYELILCIVNPGFSETVMDVAHEYGARGGTVIQARGTANKEAEEFFKITITPEKEMVMLVVPISIRDDILHGLYRTVGLNSPGHGIAFSLPVDNVVGFSVTSEPFLAVPKTEEEGGAAAEDKEGARKAEDENPER